jgi:hypothetical protein
VRKETSSLLELLDLELNIDLSIPLFGVFFLSGKLFWAVEYDEVIADEDMEKSLLPEDGFNNFVSLNLKLGFLLSGELFLF